MTMDFPKPGDTLHFRHLSNAVCTKVDGSILSYEFADDLKYISKYFQIENELRMSNSHKDVSDILSITRAPENEKHQVWLMLYKTRYGSLRSALVPTGGFIDGAYEIIAKRMIYEIEEGEGL